MTRKNSSGPELISYYENYNFLALKWLEELAAQSGGLVFFFEDKLYKMYRDKSWSLAISATIFLT